MLLTSIPSGQYVADRFGRFEDTELGRKLVYGMPVSELVYLFVFTFFLSILGFWNLVSARKKKIQTEQTLNDPKSRKSKEIHRKEYSPTLNTKSVILLLLVGIFFGAFSSLLGIGGGFLAVPLFVYYFRMEPVSAVATSFLGIFFTSMGTSLLFYFQGKLFLDLAIVGTVGGLIGARLGSLKAIDAKPYIILQVLGIMQIIVVIWYSANKFLNRS